MYFKQLSFIKFIFEAFREYYSKFSSVGENFNLISRYFVSESIFLGM